eukprot:4398161-Pyramimonas_sp.AAC.1
MGWACVRLGAPQAGVDTINDWTLQDFGGQVDLRNMCFGAVKYAQALCLRKLEFLDRVPYLFARLDEPGVAARTIQQFLSAPLEAHHPLTLEFLGPSSVLKVHVHKLAENGGEMPDILFARVQSLKDVPFDDHVAEGPHAAAKRILSNGRSTRFPFVSATLRLNQNLRDKDGLLRETGATMQHIWNTWSRVVNMKDPN